MADSRSRGPRDRAHARKAPKAGPRVRERGAKIREAAVAGVRGGHPWIFRDSLLRPVEGVPMDAPVPVMDPDGRFLAWALPEPDGAVALRVWSRVERLPWGPEEVARRVAAARALRAEVLDAGCAATHRAIHAEGDALPGVAVDRLGSHLLVYRYARCADPLLEPLFDALMEQHAEDGVVGIYLQDRTRPVTGEDARAGATLVRGERAEPEIVVEEDGLRFGVDPSAPVSPGLFLDLREGRRWLEADAQGRRVLNLFSYTGAFGMRAIRAGAERVVNVDSAARSHARCRRNSELSGLERECEAVTGDVFAYLAKTARRGDTFDRVVIDPPPFSRVKGRMFSALRNWQELMEAVSPVVAPEGELLAVSNAAKLSEEVFAQALAGGAMSAGREATLLGEWGLGADFPVPPAFVEGRYLKIRRVRLRG